jgi:phage FluMu protein Com
MSDTARCPFCQKYIDVTFKLESCPKCNKSLAGIELKNEVVKSNEMAMLYALLGAAAYAIVGTIAVVSLSDLLGFRGKSCSSAIAAGIISSTILVYHSVDKYFSEK